MKNAYINGTGSYLPLRSLSNNELAAQIDTSHEWIFSRTGINSRHIASLEETTSFMASEAAKKAIAASKISADDIDLIIVATCTPDYFFPNVACHVQHALQIKKPIPAFDVGAACSGFIYAISIARQYLSSGAAKHVLVIGSEKMSKTVDWHDRKTCVLFGDGAGALVLSASEEQEGVIGSVLHAAHDETYLLSYANDKNAFVNMNGSEVFKLAVNMMGGVVDEVLADCQLQKSDIKWLIPHQANIRIIQAMAKKLDLPMSQVITTIENQGNTSAASIPLALDYSVREQKIKRGDLILMEAFGGGLTWGAMVVRY